MCKSCFGCLSMNTNRWQDQSFFVGWRNIRSCTLFFRGGKKAIFAFFAFSLKMRFSARDLGKKSSDEKKPKETRFENKFLRLYFHFCVFLPSPYTILFWFLFFLNRSLCNDATIFIWYLWNISRPNQKSQICHSFPFPQLSLIASSFLAVNNCNARKRQKYSILNFLPVSVD